MGAVLNNHTAYPALNKAEAERIAVVRARSIASIVEAAAAFDEAGQAFWEDRYDDAGSYATSGFELLRTARDDLARVARSDIAYEDTHRQSKKRMKAIELGLDSHEYNTDRFLAARLAYDRRLVDLIDHILLSEVPATRGVGGGDMSTLYKAVSSPMRTLLEVATDQLDSLVHQARVTHEVANTVEMIWADEQAQEEKAELTRQD